MCTTDTAQETAKLEAQAFELEQKTAIAHEAKTVLDSWVRYEGQVKQRQQRELAESIIAKIEKELENPKTLKQILDQSISDVESAYVISAARMYANKRRDRLPEGISVQQHLLVKSVQCYIHLCNSQAHSIESTPGWGKGQESHCVSDVVFCFYNRGPSLSNNPLTVSAHFCATSWEIAFML
jgi:hypothetical protein